MARLTIADLIRAGDPFGVMPQSDAIKPYYNSLTHSPQLRADRPNYAEIDRIAFNDQLQRLATLPFNRELLAKVMRPKLRLHYSPLLGWCMEDKQAGRFTHWRVNDKVLMRSLERHPRPFAYTANEVACSLEDFTNDRT